MTPLQERVVELAKKELLSQGVKTVCLDELCDDREILDMGIEDAVDALVRDTRYWEGGF